ncbi:MAG: hypothetical protein ACRBFS_24340 [Aureispira sp.]
MLIESEPFKPEEWDDFKDQINAPETTYKSKNFLFRYERTIGNSTESVLAHLLLAVFYLAELMEVDLANSLIRINHKNRHWGLKQFLVRLEEPLYNHKPISARETLNITGMLSYLDSASLSERPFMTALLDLICKHVFKNYEGNRLRAMTELLATTLLYYKGQYTNAQDLAAATGIPLKEQ